jgi:hypothetical protein
MTRKIECKAADLHAAIDEAMKHPIRCCYFCGSTFRPDPGPDGQSQRWCSDECSYDSRNLSEEER